MYMSKPMQVSDAAYAVLSAQKGPDESFSDVILRCVPEPIETFGDLLVYLRASKEPLMDPQFLKDLRNRKRHPKRSPRKSNAH
jgi:predicted CopG family antitoxin